MPHDELRGPSIAMHIRRVALQLIPTLSLVMLAGCGRTELGDLVSNTIPAVDAAADATSVIDATPGDAGSDSPFPSPKAVYAGNYTSFAVLENGKLATWGRNDSGALGREGDGKLSVNEVAFDLVAIAAAGHTCFLDSAGALRCAGPNRDSELGDGTQIDRASPTLVSVISDPVRLFAVGGNETCAYTTPPTLYCTLLGKVSVGAEYIDLAKGGNFLCALNNDTTVFCWGDYGIWQHGVSYVGAKAGNVMGVNGIVQVVAGFDHSCARTALGMVWCWGDHGYGQLGVTTPPPPCTTTSCTPQPILVELPNGVRAAKIAANNSATLAITTDGRLFGWGGLQVDGTCHSHPVCSNLPRQLVDFTDVVDAAMGGAHICVLRRDKSIWCWGQNDYRQVSGVWGTYLNDPVRVIPP
jgi:alpha-tubulin suppressor-like RCC1 family protein